jgi:predicted Zn finger-like uncharacterized protein
MLVRCPRCETGFNLPVEKIPDKGAKLKCSACTHKFRVRLDDAGEPEIFYKKKGNDDFQNRTMIGTPISEASIDDENSTQFGIPSRARTRSKSARADYDPFPLANKGSTDDAEEEAPDAGDRTQFGSPTAVGKDPADQEEEGDVELFDEPFDGGGGDRTMLGPAARSSASDSQPSAPPPTPGGEDDERGQTQALGSGGVDLFDGEFDDESADAVSLAEESDPFGDAFEDSMEGGAGLLMPSTPESEDDLALDPTSLSEGSYDSEPHSEPPAEMGMSEDDFLSGQQVSEFGPVEDLVDPSFGADVPSFDPSGGVVNREKRPRPKRKPKTRTGEHDRKPRSSGIELEDVRQEKSRPAERPRPESASRPKDPDSGARKPARKIPNDYAPHRVGAPSTARRLFDVFAIALVVCVTFVGFVGARAGWVLDFKRFGHMLEVAFAGVEFQPREEWKTVVEIPPPEPPPEDPLRLEEVTAREYLVGETPIFVISGRVRNYSLESFQKVKVRAEIVDESDEAVAEQTVLAGQSLEREKLAGVQSVEEVPDLVDKKVPDIGKEGSIPFTVVFTDLPAEKLEAGELNYRISLAN